MSALSSARSILVEGAAPDGAPRIYELAVEEIVDGHSSAWRCIAPDGRSTWSRDGAHRAADEFVRQLAAGHEVLPDTVTIRLVSPYGSLTTLWL